MHANHKNIMEEVIPSPRPAPKLIVRTNQTPRNRYFGNSMTMIEEPIRKGEINAGSSINYLPF